MNRHTSKIGKKYIYLILTVVLFLSFCASQVCASEKRKTTLTFVDGYEVSLLDPQMMPNMGGWAVVPNIFDTLVKRDIKGDIHPSLALEWKNVSPTKWQFKLRQGVKFHNGEVFNAHAVKFTMERLADPKEGMVARYLFTTITGAEVVDEYTVNILTDKPDPVLPRRMSSMGSQIVPPKYLEKIGKVNFARKPIGTGPYKFVDWKPDTHIILEANEDYWGGVPYYKRYVFKPMPESSSRVAAIMTGEADIVNHVPPHQAAAIEKNSGTSIASTLNGQIIVLAINAEQQPFNDKRVRQALNYAVDKETICSSLFLGYTKPLNGPIPWVDFGYNPDLEPYPYDVEKAKALLSEAGHKEGFSFTLIGTQGNTLMDREVIEAVAGMYRQIGLKPQIRWVDAAERARVIRNHGIDGMFIINPMSMIGDADGDFWRVLKPKAILDYLHNPQIEKLLSAAQNNLNPSEREKQYHEASKLFREEAGWVFLYTDAWVVGVSDDIEFKPRWDGFIYANDIGVKVK